MTMYAEVPASLRDIEIENQVRRRNLQAGMDMAEFVLRHVRKSDDAVSIGRICTQDALDIMSAFEWLNFTYTHEVPTVIAPEAFGLDRPTFRELNARVNDALLVRTPAV